MSTNLGDRHSPVTAPVFPNHSVYFSEAGLTISGSLIEAHPVIYSSGSGPGPGCARLEALFAIAFRKKLAPRSLQTLAEAASHSRNGNHIQANIRLAMGRLTSIPEPHQIGLRLELADKLLLGGMPAHVLMKELGFAPSDALAHAYNPDQPRVPAGAGVASGRWISGADGGDAVAEVSPSKSPPGHVAEMPVSDYPDEVPKAESMRALMPPIGVPALFDAGLGAARLAALATAAEAWVAAGVGLTLGLVLVPLHQHTDNATGSLPGDSGTRYDYRPDEGRLRLFDSVGNPIADAFRGKNGVFYDQATGFPIARDLGHALTFDQDQIDQAANDNDGRKPATRAAANDNAPRLCPAPSFDVPNSTRPRARAYQMQITALMNGGVGLPEGWAVRLRNPVTGESVPYDGCREIDGTMIEAKGPGYERLLQDPNIKKGIIDRFLGQAKSQIQAAGQREVEWYFAEEGVEKFARDLFDNSGGIAKIKTFHVPALMK